MKETIMDDITVLKLGTMQWFSVVTFGLPI